MPRRLPTLLWVLMEGSFVSAVFAQQAPPPNGTPQQAPPVAAPQIPPPSAGPQKTPPIPPNVKETPIPPPVGIPSLQPPADVPNRPITAEEAARIALRRQPDITIARAEIAAAQGRTRQVRSGLLPTLSLSGSYTNVSVLSGQNGTAVTSTGTGTGTTGGGSGGTGGGGTGGSGGTGTGGTGTGGTGTGGNGGTGTGGSGNGGAGGTGTGGTGTGTTTGPTTVTPLGATSATQASGFLFSATVRQLIFDFNHTRDLVRQSSALERAAQQNLSRVQSDLVFEVKQAFYIYLQDTRLVAVNEANVANRQAQLEEARARLNSGLGLPADVVTAETAVAEGVLNLNVARNNASLARVNLAFLMGIDPRIPLVPSDTTEPPFASNDVNGLLDMALKQRPEILQAQETINANRYGLSAARTTNAPVISGNLGVTSRGADFPTDDNLFSIGASITFSPFDGGLTAGRVQEARANLTQAQAQLVSAQQTVAADVTQAYFNLRTAEQRVTTADIEVTNAQEGVRIAEGRYRTGLGLFLDIINAQALLLTANTNRVQAQSAVDQARAAINRAIGSPLAAATLR